MSSVIVMFSTIGQHVPAFKKEKRLQAKPESLVSRLHYRGTCLLILCCVILVTCPEWIAGTGVNIDCMHGGSIPDKTINNYCYIQGTFLVPRHITDGDTQQGRDNSQTGVGPYDPLDGKDEIRVKAYYQWVPFVLFMQALLFYAPHLIYKAAEGGRVRTVLGSLHLFVLSKETRAGAVGDLAAWFGDSLGIHNRWGVRILLAQSLYLVNVVAQIFFTDMFLGYEFSTYGVHAASFLEQEAGDRADPMSRVFPRVTKCTFHKYGPTGSIQRHDAQCILPINIINEKIYVFLWFWFILVAILTCLDLIHRIGQAVMPAVRMHVLNRKLATVAKFKVDKMRDNVDLRLVCSSLQHGDWQLLYALIQNMDSVTYLEWLAALTEVLREREERKGGKGEPARAPLLPLMKGVLHTE